MSDKRKKPVRLPPRWFVRAAWYVHRAMYRVTGSRKGLWLPKPNRWGTSVSPRRDVGNLNYLHADPRYQRARQESIHRSPFMPLIMILFVLALSVCVANIVNGRGDEAMTTSTTLDN
jgi:hypothetical protein